MSQWTTMFNKRLKTVNRLFVSLKQLGMKKDPISGLAVPEYQKNRKQRRWDRKASRSRKWRSRWRHPVNPGGYHMRVFRSMIQSNDKSVVEWGARFG